MIDFYKIKGEISSVVNRGQEATRERIVSNLHERTRAPKEEIERLIYLAKATGEIDIDDNILRVPSHEEKLERIRNRRIEIDRRNNMKISDDLANKIASAITSDNLAEIREEITSRIMEKIIVLLYKSNQEMLKKIEAIISDLVFQHLATIENLNTYDTLMNSQNQDPK